MGPEAVSTTNDPPLNGTRSAASTMLTIASIFSFRLSLVDAQSRPLVSSHHDRPAMTAKNTFQNDVPLVIRQTS